MAHAAPLGAEHKVPAMAVDAMATGNGGRAENTKLLSQRQTLHVFSNLHNRGGHFVTHNDRRETTEGVMVDVEICAADTAPGDFEFDLLGAARRFLHVTDLHVAGTFRVFDQGFHCVE
jgi:hypothetical protein